MASLPVANAIPKLLLKSTGNRRPGLLMLCSGPARSAAAVLGLSDPLGDLRAAIHAESVQQAAVARHADQAGQPLDVGGQHPFTAACDKGGGVQALGREGEDVHHPVRLSGPVRFETPEEYCLVGIIAGWRRRSVKVTTYASCWLGCRQRRFGAARWEVVRHVSGDRHVASLRDLHRD